MILHIINSNETPRDKFIIIVAFLFAALFAIIFHEVAHGYAAKLNGDDTAKSMGRLSFNPAKHFDPLGFLMFALVGFGWAKPVPINPNNFKNFKKGVITTSLAGVFANLICSIVSFGLLLATVQIGISVGINNAVGEIFYLLFMYFFLYSTIINISLIAFNIIPVYPLDGFNVLAMITKPGNRVVAFLRRYGYFILLGLLLIGSVIPAFDVIGMYFNVVQVAIFKLFSLIFGSVI